jgi:hypothetical protein
MTAAGAPQCTTALRLDAVVCLKPAEHIPVTPLEEIGPVLFVTLVGPYRSDWF